MWTIEVRPWGSMGDAPWIDVTDQLEKGNAATLEDVLAAGLKWKGMNQHIRMTWVPKYAL